MAARIERAECETVLAFAARLQARGTEVMIRDIGGGSAVFAGAGQPINKLAGLGFSGPIDEDALAAIEGEDDERRRPNPSSATRSWKCSWRRAAWKR